MKIQKTFSTQSGLTLIEMMVATTLLVVMMLGLTAMFNQTQRAFRGGLKQVDLFENGRAVMDMVARDIEQLAPSAAADRSLYGGLLEATIPGYTPFIQLTPSGTSDLRTNVKHGVFLLNRSDNWSAIGYRIVDPVNTNNLLNFPYGTLYRFSTNVAKLGPVQDAYLNILYYQTPSFLIDSRYMTRVAEGVVHFKLTFYDAAGHVITNNAPGVNVISVSSSRIYDERVTSFNSNALPAMVEVELGILEPQTLQQAQSLPNTGAAPTPRTTYLRKQGSKVHIFRQQIPIRNAPR